MKTIEEVSKLIAAGQTLFLAGSEKALSKLPKGNWIGGTIPYFMTKNGGMITEDLIHATSAPPEVSSVVIKVYEQNQLPSIPNSYAKNGFTFLVLPAFSEAHQTFAKDCSTWRGLFNQPLVGWVSGIDLKSTGNRPQVIDGQTGIFYDNAALAMHLELNPGSYAKANIINIFRQGEGDVITFPKAGFEVSTAFINGREVSFRDYLEKQKLNLQLPLVANYMGAMINVSFRDFDSKTDRVRLYAPVFPGVEYRQALPISNYESEFEQALQKEKIHQPLFCCNCILNFIYANLEGRKSGHVVSAMTFGEIAYMLLNQTLVYITLEKSGS